MAAEQTAPSAPGQRHAGRILVWLPDAHELSQAVDALASAGPSVVVCESLTSLCEELATGADAVLIAAETLEASAARLTEALALQPAWSDVPVIVTLRDAEQESALVGVFPRALFVDRDHGPRALRRVLTNSLRARASQFALRDALDERARLTAELARRTAQLEVSDRQKDEFLATLAHELRNPLAPISTGLTILLTESGPEQTRRAVSIMERQINHMVRLIDDLLDVSRLTTGRLELKRARVSLTGVLESAIEGSLPNIERSHIFHKRFAHEPLFVDADQARLAQVVGNLLNNAGRFTPPGGHIELATRRDGNHVLITVRDSGVGIPRDRLEEVFEMFSQVQRQTERSQGGLGIGLHLVKKLVELHGGSVTAESEGDARGSLFTVRLPLSEAQSGLNLPSQSAESEKKPQKRVLVVDDNDDAAELLSFMLQQVGYRTTTAHSGQEALDEAARVAPEVAILDIGLPDIDGYEVARALRKRVGSQVVLIALTGWGSRDDKQRALDAGFDLHLTKPVVASALHEALAQLTQNRAVR